MGWSQSGGQPIPFWGSVQLPDGIAGLSLGTVGTTATDFLGAAAGGNGRDHHNLGNAGFGEGGLNDERSLMDTEAVLGQPTRSFGIDCARLGTNQKGILDGNPSVSSDFHSINTSGYTDLSLCQHFSFFSLASSIMDKSVADESNVIEKGAFINQGAVKISDFDGCFESSAPGSERTIPHFEINNVQGLTLVPFPEISPLRGELNGLEIVNSFQYFGEQGASV